MRPGCGPSKSSGVWVPIWPVDAAALPEWLRAQRENAQDGHRARGRAADRRSRRGQSARRASRSWRNSVCWREGESISADLVLRSVGDSARYDVFQLAAGGGRRRCARVPCACCSVLKSEGRGADTDSVGVAAGIAWNVAGARARAVALAESRQRLEPGRRAVAARAVAARKSCRWRACCCRPATTDRVIKGLATGRCMERAHRPHRSARRCFASQRGIRQG